MQKTPYVFPIIGGRKIEHLHQNIEALEVALTPEHIKYLESILPFDIGFPAIHFVGLFPLYNTQYILNNSFTTGNGG